MSLKYKSCPLILLRVLSYNTISIIIYTREISRYLKEKYLRRSGSRNIKICDNRRIFDGLEKKKLKNLEGDMIRQ